MGKGIVVPFLEKTSVIWTNPSRPPAKPGISSAQSTMCWDGGGENDDVCRRKSLPSTLSSSVTASPGSRSTLRPSSRLPALGSQAGHSPPEPNTAPTCHFRRGRATETAPRANHCCYRSSLSGKPGRQKAEEICTLSRARRQEGNRERAPGNRTFDCRTPASNRYTGAPKPPLRMTAVSRKVG